MTNFISVSIAVLLIAFVVLAVWIYTLSKRIVFCLRFAVSNAELDALRVKRTSEDIQILWVYILAKENKTLKSNPNLLSIREAKLQEVREWVEKCDKVANNTEKESK